MLTVYARGYHLANGTPGEATGDYLSNIKARMVLTYTSTPSDDSTSWYIVTTTLDSSSTVRAILLSVRTLQLQLQHPRRSLSHL